MRMGDRAENSARPLVRVSALLAITQELVPVVHCTERERSRARVPFSLAISRLCLMLPLFVLVSCCPLVLYCHSRFEFNQ